MVNSHTKRAAGLLLLVFLFLCAGASLACGLTPDEIKERMLERLPEIDALKKEQLVGENRKGLLEPLQTLSGDQVEMVREENGDREKVYEALAAQSKATAKQVGAIRARQIAERSARGVMIEDENGEWVEKR